METRCIYFPKAVPSSPQASALSFLKLPYFEQPIRASIEHHRQKRNLVSSLLFCVLFCFLQQPTYMQWHPYFSITARVLALLESEFQQCKTQIEFGHKPLKWPWAWKFIFLHNLLYTPSPQVVPLSFSRGLKVAYKRAAVVITDHLNDRHSVTDQALLSMGSLKIPTIQEKEKHTSPHWHVRKHSI